MAQKLTIAEIVRKAEQLDELGNTTISKYVDFSLRETIEKIDAYLNSKHISGDLDSMGREKPFFNIVTAAVNVWFRATDIDRKNIKVKATKSGDYTLAFLATILLQEWMKKNNFGVFLNEWGRVLARYGSAVVKFVEKGGELYSEVIPWNRLIIDPVDFENNIKIEKLWFTPSQLKKQKGYDKDLVDKLIENTTSKTLLGNGMKVNNKNEYIPVYEVHGELPLSLLTGNDEDDETYVQQMHVITFTQTKDNGKGYDDYTLIAGREAKDPYMITHLIKEDGRSLSIGAVEHLFEAQWMCNHSVKQIKDQLDLASKLLFQTSDGNFVGQNVLSNIENGDILIHSVNQPLTQLNNKPDIGAMQSYAQQWQALGNQINGISEAMMGQTQPSGTAWRQTQALLQESHSLFELMTENKGLYIEEMLTKYVIPNLKKKIDTADEISAILEDNQIKQLDQMYVPNQAIRLVNEQIKKTILSGQIYDTTQQEAQIGAVAQSLQKDLSNLGNQRFIKPSDIKDTTWKEIMKNIEWELEFDITGESKDTQAVMATLTTVLQTIASNPMILQDPNAKMIFNKIIAETGAISPLEINQAQVQPAPQGVPVGGGQPMPMNQLTQ